MKKNLVRTALGLFVLITFATSAYPQWILTNWPAGNSFFSLYTSQDRVFARTWDSLSGGRMFLTADNGANWTPITPADGNSDILSIVQLDNDMLAGTWNGFYRSASGGTSWIAVTPAGMPADTAVWSVAKINTTLYAGTMGDLFKSSDNGTTWIEIKSGIPADARMRCIVASGTALFAGSDTSGVFMTTNGGTSWTAVNSGLTDRRIRQLAVMGDKLFAVTLSGVFVSGNNGTIWTANSSGLRNINCFTVVNNQLFAGTDSSGVYLSVDGGATWTPFNAGIPEATRVWSLGTTSGYIFAGTSAGVWRTPADTARFTITTGASEGGTISPQGDIPVYKYGSQTLTIAPATGYRVGTVLVDGVSAGAVTSYTFLNVTTNHTISAVFTAVPTYTIVASAGNGGTISPSGSVVVSEGSSSTFTIRPSTGYSLASVMVDGSPVAAVPTYTFTNVTGNHTISAAFVSAPYTITASSGSGGSISPSGAVTIPAGSSQTFSITPSTGYEVSGVLVDGVSVGSVPSYVFSSVTSNHTISALFSSLTKYQINCGGSASSPYTADQYYSGGSTYSVTSAIVMTGVTNPAPQAVYRTERYGAVTYTIPSLTGGASYKVRLHFSENYMSATGKRRFNVAINGTTVLSNYDIYAETGARYKVVVKEYTATATTAGQIVISFANVTDNAKIDGIEIVKLITNTAPTIVTAASANPNPVIASTTTLSALGADDNGESSLTYTWTTTGNPPASVMLSVNGSNAAKTTEVTFKKAGSYLFQVTVADQGGLTVASPVGVLVDQTLTSIRVSPAGVLVNAAETKQFSATACDQFLTALPAQPAFAWSVNGGGTMDANGLLTAGTTAGSFTVTVSSAGVSGTAGVTVVVPNNAPTIAAAASANPSPVTAATTSLSVLGADDNGESNLTYTWTTTGTPPAAVTFSANGTNAAKAPTATFAKAGSYSFQAMVTDADGLTATSAVSVTVNQTLTGIVLSPASATVNTSATQQFTATARDQFAAALSTQPAFIWSAGGGGTISSSGLFTAGTTAGGPYTVTAQSGGKSGTANVTVTSSPATKYEAENATLSGGANKNTNHTGYSGTGFVDGYYNSTTAQTSFTVNGSSAGSYIIKLHYSAGNGASTNTGLYVNGTKIKNITCPVTANWNTWADESETITLNAGNNTVAYKAVTSSTSCINLDYISVAK